MIQVPCHRVATAHDPGTASVIPTGKGGRDIRKKPEKCKENPMKLLKTKTIITTVLELLLWGMEEGRWHVQNPGLGLGQAWGTSA